MSLKQKRSETVAGLFLVLGLGVLAVLIIKFGRLGDAGMDGKYMVDLTFNDASGLIKGSEVRMGGARIGKVVSIPELQDDLRVKVKLKLDDRIKIDKASSFQIQSLSIIGDKMIIVGKPEVNSGEYIRDGDQLIGGGSGGLDAIQSDAESVARDARVLMKDARTTLLKVDSSIDDIRSVAGRLSESVEKVNTDLLDKENMASIKRSISNLEEVTASFKGVGKEIDPTFKQIRLAIANVSKAADAATKTFTDASAQLQHIKPALENVPQAIASIKRAANKATTTLNSADNAIAKITKGDGLIKTLSTDKEFDKDTKQFVKNLKHHGILRYKDDETADPKDPKENRYRSKRRR